MARLALDRHRAVMRRDDVLHHRQPQPTARWLQRHLGSRQPVELLEHPSLLMLGNARPVVRDADRHLRTGRNFAELLRVMLDSAGSQEGLDCEGLLAILEPMKVYNRATTLLRADGMHFSFNRRLDGEEVDAARETALRDLDEYIGVLVTQPEIRTRLAEATADYMRTMDDEGHARQQKLRAMDEELTRRLAALSDSSQG